MHTPYITSHRCQDDLHMFDIIKTLKKPFFNNAYEKRSYLFLLRNIYITTQYWYENKGLTFFFDTRLNKNTCSTYLYFALSLSLSLSVSLFLYLSVGDNNRMNWLSIKYIDRILLRKIKFKKSLYYDSVYLYILYKSICISLLLILKYYTSIRYQFVWATIKLASQLLIIIQRRMPSKIMIEKIIISNKICMRRKSDHERSNQHYQKMSHS